MQMLDFKDIFVFFCKLNNFGSVLGSPLYVQCKIKKEQKSLTTNTMMKPDTIKKVRFPVYESVLHNVLIIMGISLSP